MKVIIFLYFMVLMVYGIEKERMEIMVVGMVGAWVTFHFIWKG